MLGSFILWFRCYGLAQTPSQSSPSRPSTPPTQRKQMALMLYSHVYSWQNDKGVRPVSMPGSYEWHPRWHHQHHRRMRLGSNICFNYHWRLCWFISIGSYSLLLKLHLDDVVHAVHVHFFNGILGLICTGLFATPEYMINYTKKIITLDCLWSRE